jgi:hypothetical protein
MIATLSRSAVQKDYRWNPSGGPSGDAIPKAHVVDYNLVGTLTQPRACRGGGRLAISALPGP